MTQEEKLLLFKDLCSRLPYGVKINIYDDYSGMMKDEELNIFHLDSTYNIEYKKLRPYLRPMSSMTEKEKKERDFYCGYKPYDKNIGESYLTEYDMPDYLDWLLANHFDFHGLIEKGLALEAPKDMYKTE